MTKPSVNQKDCFAHKEHSLTMTNLNGKNFNKGEHHVERILS